MTSAAASLCCDITTLSRYLTGQKQSYNRAEFKNGAPYTNARPPDRAAAPPRLDLVLAG